MLKAGTVEEYLAGRHQAHGGRRSQEVDLADVDLKTLRVANKAGQRADPPEHRHGRARAGQGRGEGRGPDRQDPPAGRAAPGRHPAGEGVHRREAEDLGGRQDGRPARQQGHRRPHRAGGGHAVPAGRHAGGHRAQPARRAEPHERGPDPRDPPRLGARGSSASRPRPRSSGAPTRPRSACCSAWRASAGRPRGCSSGTQAPVLAPAAITRMVHDLKKVAPKGERTTLRRGRHRHARRAGRVGRDPGALPRRCAGSWSTRPRSWPSASWPSAGRSWSSTRPPATNGRTPRRSAKAAEGAGEGGGREPGRGARGGGQAGAGRPARAQGRERRGRGGRRAAARRGAHAGGQGAAARRPDRPVRSRATSRSARSTC